MVVVVLKIKYIVAGGGRVPGIPKQWPPALRLRPGEPLSGTLETANEDDHCQTEDCIDKEKCSKRGLIPETLFSNCPLK